MCKSRQKARCIFKTQCLTCERRPLIYFQRGPPTPLHRPPLVWCTFGLHPRPKNSRGWWGVDRCGRKKKREMFSSGCNLSLSCLQHSRVILQQGPWRRTEVALCLGLTQASHPSETRRSHWAATVCAAETLVPPSPAAISSFFFFFNRISHPQFQRPECRIFFQFSVNFLADVYKKIASG